MRANKLRVEDKSNRVRCREYKFYEKNFGLKANQTSCVVEVSECMKKYGGVAQLGEHLPCKQGVDSSILFISTKS